MTRLASPNASIPGANVGEAIIRTEQLTKQYGNGTAVLAVDRLDLDVREGEIFGLLGPNGAGKTTTIGMLTTRVRPTSGRAFIGSVDVAKRPAVRSLTVFENLYYHGLYFGMAGKESKRRQAVHRRGHPAEHTRLIARALVHDPPLLFLDVARSLRMKRSSNWSVRRHGPAAHEPTSGIDPQTRLALWDIVRELNRLGHTILLTTHYMEEAEQLCDRIAIMDHGKILANDTPEALKRSIGAETVIILHVDGEFGATRAAIQGVASVDRVEGEDGRFQIFATNDPAVVARVVTAAASAGANVRDLSVSPPTLENVFIQLTGRALRE